MDEADAKRIKEQLERIGVLFSGVLRADEALVDGWSEEERREVFAYLGTLLLADPNPEAAVSCVAGAASFGYVRGWHRGFAAGQAAAMARLMGVRKEGGE